MYLGIGIALLRQIYIASKEKFRNKERFFTIGFLLGVLLLTFLKPNGIINFESFEGANILIAEREGAANCMTTLKLNDDYTFKERNVCFGVTEIKGKYKLQNDTIYFYDIELGRQENDFYKYAIIKPSRFSTNGNFDIVRYKNLSDTIGHELWITKNNISNKKPTANRR